METNLTFVPRRTYTGLLLLGIGMVVAGIASSAAVPASLSPNSMEQFASGAAMPPLWLTILGCLSPIALILEIVALFVIASEASKFGKDTLFPVRLGSILYLVAIVLSIGATIPLSLMISTDGSLELAVLQSTITAVISLFAILGLALAIYPYAGPLMQKLIIAVSVLQGVATLAASSVSTTGMRVTEFEIQNITRYMVQPNTSGLYPALLIAGLVCSWVLTLIVILMVVQYSRLMKNVRTESVA